LGNPAADPFKISFVVEDRALVFGVAVSANTQGNFTFHASLFWMVLPFSMTGLALDPLKVKGNL
jgi:hypothetical protein